MKGDTSQSQQTLAALKSFGLVVYKGSGPKRLVAISDDGRTYLRAQQDTIKQQVLKRVALKPKWIAYFWGKWGADKVPDELRLDELVLTHKFNENSAPKFLGVYDGTIAFAGLATSDKVSPPPSPDDGDEEPELPNVEVGDSVQWVSQDARQFPAPKRVRAISPDHQWVFVEGSETGIPMQHVEVVEKSDASGQGSSSPPSLPLEEGQAGDKWEEERLIDDDGELILIRYRGKPSADRYAYIRDYLDFKLKRMKGPTS
jgi:hypothetical protein